MSILNHLILLLFPLLSTALTDTLVTPHEPHKKQKEFNIPHNRNSKNPIEFSVIEGMVYCQSCGTRGSWSLAGAKPLPSAKVGIACKDQKNIVWFYKAFEADGNGYFYAPIEGIDGVTEAEKKKKEIGCCRVHLLASSDSSCNIPTNINMGIAGAQAGKEKTMKKGENYEVVVYSAPPLAFRPATCPYIQLIDV